MADDLPQRPEPECPVCGKPTVATHRPFCSSRCADVDLQRWFSGVYAIPLPESEEEGEDPREQP